MGPFFGFYSWPSWIVVLALLILTGLAVTAPFFVRRRVGLERLVLNNEVAGFKYATLGVIYAVLLAFAVITVWEEYEEAADQVRDESSVVAAMHQLAEELPQNLREPALNELAAYLSAVITTEWPAMAAGRGATDEATAALHQLYQRYLGARPADPAVATLIDKSLDLLIRLSEIRRERLDSAEGSLPAVLGATLVIGAVLTVGFTLFFGAPNVVAQASMTGIICLMVLLVLFATMMLNRPFSGDVSVSPHPLADVLDQLAASPG